MVFMWLLGSLALNVCNGCSVQCKHDLKHLYGSQKNRLSPQICRFYLLYRFQGDLGLFFVFVSNWPSLYCIMSYWFFMSLLYYVLLIIYVTNCIMSYWLFMSVLYYIWSYWFFMSLLYYVLLILYVAIVLCLIDYLCHYCIMSYWFFMSL
jgi:hypothetical protein